MTITWIVVADSSRARLFQSATGSRQISEIEDLVNPAAREMNRDLVTDAQGRRSGGGATSAPTRSAGAHSDPLEHEAELFAKRVTEAIEAGRTGSRYDDLCLIAAPKFLGLLRANLGKDARRLVSREIDKDLSQKSGPEILDYVRDRARR